MFYSTPAKFGGQLDPVETPKRSFSVSALLGSFATQRCELLPGSEAQDFRCWMGGCNSWPGMTWDLLTGYWVVMIQIRVTMMKPR